MAPRFASLRSVKSHFRALVAARKGRRLIHGSARLGRNAGEGTRFNRRIFALAGLIVAAAASVNASADTPSAPIAVQAQVITRILPFERGFAARAPSEVRVVIALRPGDADSESAALKMAKALDDIGTVANRPLRVSTVNFVSAQQLSAECRKRSAHVLFITPGLSAEVSQIATGLIGSGMLSVAAVETYVPGGIVLGVEVVAGKPHMSVNLKQAKSQKLDFPSAVLKLARIY